MIRSFGNASFAFVLIASFMFIPQLGFAQNPTGLPQSLNVNVTNTPLPVQGTISGTVTVTNQPNVFVTNTATNPVATRDVNSPPRTPYMVRLSCTSAQGTSNSNGCNVTFAAIPVGKRLILQHVNAAIQLGGVGPTFQVQQYGLFINGQESVTLPPRLVTNVGVTNYAVNEPVLVFVEAGQKVLAQAVSSEIGVIMTTILSGYLVDSN
jgi:hypothetical protein